MLARYYESATNHIRPLVFLFPGSIDIDTKFLLKLGPILPLVKQILDLVFSFTWKPCIVKIFDRQ